MTPPGPNSQLSEFYCLNPVGTPDSTFTDQVSPLQNAASKALSLAPERLYREESLPSPSTPDTTGSALSKTTARLIKKRATAKNPIYGRVTGVLRGASLSHGNLLYL